MLAHTGGGRFSFWVLDARSMTRCSLLNPPSRRATERALYTYRVHLVDGSSAGEATYSVMIHRVRRSSSATAGACVSWPSFRSRRRTSRRSLGCYRSRWSRPV